MWRHPSSCTRTSHNRRPIPQRCLVPEVYLIGRREDCKLPGEYEGRDRGADRHLGAPAGLTSAWRSGRCSAGVGSRAQHREASRQSRSDSLRQYMIGCEHPAHLSCGRCTPVAKPWLMLQDAMCDVFSVHNSFRYEHAACSPSALLVQVSSVAPYRGQNTLPEAGLARVPLFTAWCYTLRKCEASRQHRRQSGSICGLMVLAFWRNL